MSRKGHDLAIARTVPLQGILAVMSGCGLLFVQRKFYRLTADWSVLGQRLFVLGALLLIVWGLHQLRTSIWPQQRTGRVRLLNRHRVGASREGLLYLFIFALLFFGSLLGRSNMLMLVSSMMAGPFVLNGWISYSMLRRTSLSRRIPKRVMAGVMVSVDIMLVNRKRWLSSWVMAVRDRIENMHERLDAGVLFVRVPPRGRQAAHYELQLMQRGTYTFGPVYLSSRFPLGLGERGLMSDLPDEILVYPRLGRLTSAWQREQTTAVELVQRRKTHRGVHDDEFHHIHEYRWGDNPRAIHWRTSARRNELMVRKFHQSRDQHLVVLLDLWLPDRPVDEDFDRVEMAVSFAATVCVDFMRVGRDANLHLLTCGDRTTGWEGRSGPAAVESVLDRLAMVQAGQSPDVEGLWHEWMVRRSPTTRSLMITTRKDGEHAFAGLDGAQFGRSVLECLNEIRVIEAGERQLGPFFQLD